MIHSDEYAWNDLSNVKADFMRVFKALLLFFKFLYYGVLGIAFFTHKFLNFGAHSSELRNAPQMNCMRSGGKVGLTAVRESAPEGSLRSRRDMSANIHPVREDGEFNGAMREGPKAGRIKQACKVMHYGRAFGFRFRDETGERKPSAILIIGQVLPRAEGKSASTKSCPRSRRKFQNPRTLGGKFSNLRFFF